MDEINIKKESSNEKQIRSKWEIVLPFFQIGFNFLFFLLFMIMIAIGFGLGMKGESSSGLEKLGFLLPILILIFNVFFIFFALNLFFRSQKGGKKYSILSLIISLFVLFIILYAWYKFQMFDSLFIAKTVN